MSKLPRIPEEQWREFGQEFMEIRLRVKALLDKYTKLRIFSAPSMDKYLEIILDMDLFRGAIHEEMIKRGGPRDEKIWYPERGIRGDEEGEGGSWIQDSKKHQALFLMLTDLGVPAVDAHGDIRDQMDILYDLADVLDNIPEEKRKQVMKLWKERSKGAGIN